MRKTVFISEWSYCAGAGGFAVYQQDKNLGVYCPAFQFVSCISCAEHSLWALEWSSLVVFPWVIQTLQLLTQKREFLSKGI